jgi:hypothetical protein
MSKLKAKLRRQITRIIARNAKANRRDSNDFGTCWEMARRRRPLSFDEAVNMEEIR